MEASGEEITGTTIRDNIRRMTDPEGTPVHPGAEGINAAKALIAEGKPVRYIGATGPLQFDVNGDVSAPKLTWRFEGGTNVELDYYSLEEVDALIKRLDG